MPLDTGTRLGPYEIVSPIGAGGMGEVYRANDTRLGRTVAVKILPAHIADRPELRQRFEQEARAVSSLNHPHICTLYDVGRENGIDFLVLEYIEGETLAERLTRGPVPWEEAVRYAAQLADALDKAHRAGIVHRDLKPGNVILTKSGPKLLDFGLAKLKHERGAAHDLSALTEAKPLTEKGTILGTFQYMAPEQLEGKEADARTDIFSLGAVLYEMVAGEKAFQGDTQASLIAAIMSATPRAMSETVALSPPSLDRVVSVCLEKDPDRRWQSAADLERNLDWVTPEGRASDAPLSRPVSSRGKLLAGALGLVAGIAGTAALLMTLAGGEHRAVQYFQIDLGENEGMEPGVGAHVALSPDGSLLAYTAMRDGTSHLYLRPLNEPEGRVVQGSEHAFTPFFSPDGEWVGFYAYPGDRKIKKVSVRGGAPQTIADAVTPLGATWLPDETVVFGDWSRDVGLFRVAASGGPAELLNALDRGKESFAAPQPLPDPRWVLITLLRAEGSDAVLLSLATGSRRTLVKNAAQALYVSTGHILFVRGGALWAVPFDAATQEITGSERLVLTGIEERGTASLAVSEAGNGILAYVPGEEGAWVEETLTWVTRDGQRTPATAERHDYEWPRFSPSGDRVALYTADTFEMRTDVWILDVDSGRLDRITFRKGHDQAPVWSPDGRSIILSSDRGGGTMNLYRQPVSPAGDAELLLDSEQVLVPQDVSPDGRTLAFAQGQDLYLLSLMDGTVSPFVATDASEWNAKFSPDGRWLAYISDETGQREIYVQPYPTTGGKTQVSRGGAEDPLWSANGHELYYLRGRTLVEAKLQLSPRFGVSGERELFDVPINHGRNLDLDPKTGRLLIVDKTRQSPPRYLNVVTNFFALLESEPDSP